MVWEQRQVFRSKGETEEIDDQIFFNSTLGILPVDKKV